MRPLIDCGKSLGPWLAVAGFLLWPVRVPAQPGAPAVLLTNTAQIRVLKHAEAARRIPVLLRGVVIGEAEAGGQGFSLQDDTSGIYLRGSASEVARLRPGDWLEVEGVTDPGEFAPYVEFRKLTKLGTREIPEPRRVTFDEVASGVFDAQWVEISGVVRYCEPPSSDPRKTVLEVSTGSGRLVVRLNAPYAARGIVDARVRFRGVCYYLVNKKRQLVSPLLAVPTGVPICIETPAPADPYGTPIRSISTLMQFRPDGSIGHRVHVRGIVTCQMPGELWIKEGALGLRIQTRQKDELHPGDEVDVIGFPRQGEYAPLLEDAEFRVCARKTPPLPERLAKAEEAFDHDADLVELEALVAEQQRVLSGWTFTFRADDGTLFRGSLRQTNGYDRLLDSKPGSRVKVAGLCSVTRQYSGPHSGLVQPRSFQLLLRSPVDLTLLKPAPWWTLQHIIWLLGSIVFGLLVAVAGVMIVARRRLLKQAAQRRMAETEFSAILTERNRLAREIHDTLAQGLGAISLHLGLVKTQTDHLPETAAKHIDLAYGVARASLADARTAIFNMRSQVLENGDLAAALNGVLRQMTDGTAVEARFAVTGPARRLPPVTENALLRVGQEAITNAEKHARARRIEVILEFEQRQVRLRVKDDGCGFDVNQRPRSNGGFGLVGMRERAAQLQGELLVRSQPGQGTEIAFVLPVPVEPLTST